MAEAEQQKRIITVFGATGSQGGAVLRSLVRSNEFSIRAVTRSPDKPKAQALKAIKSVTVVKADQNDLESVKAAVDGSYGVYLVTNFWAHLSEETEKKQIQIAIDACKSAGVEHIVYSTLDNTKGEFTPFGKFEHVPHFQCKFDMEEQFPAESTTFLRTTAYYDNYVGMMPPKKNEDGNYVITAPMGGKKIYLVSVEHIGNVAAEAFLNPEQSKSKILAAVGDSLTMDEIAKVISTTYGKEIMSYEPSCAEFATYFPEHGSEDLANMFQFYQDSKEFKKLRDDALSGAGDFKYPADKPFATWMFDNKSKLVLD